jgi:hypothetical protein
MAAALTRILAVTYCATPGRDHRLKPRAGHTADGGELIAARPNSHLPFHTASQSADPSSYSIHIPCLSGEPSCPQFTTGESLPDHTRLRHMQEAFDQ